MMKMIRYAIACALMGLPASALAQTSAAPVSVEIVATGEITVPAQRFRMSVKLSAKADTEDAAKAKLAANRATLVRALAAQNVRESTATEAPGGSSFMTLFASLGGRSKPSVSMDLFSENADGKPQATANETIQFDAPTRAGAANTRAAVEAAGGTLEEEVVGLLDDYAGAARKAKADALVKARVQADAYGEALGLRQAAITRISEKQDIMGGTLGFISQIVGMFAPKGGTETNNVTVRETLTVEFK
ncbi:MAG: DUF541 domain-containing protein, partial [Sphingomonadales bacterium]